MREWLMRGRKIEEEIKTIRAAKKAAEDKAVYAGIVINGSGTNGANENKVEQKNLQNLKFEDALNARLEELDNVKTEILRAISIVPSPETRSMMIEYFLCGKCFRIIGKKMNYDTSTVQKRVKEGVRYLSKNFKKK